LRAAVADIGSPPSHPLRLSQLEQEGGQCRANGVGTQAVDTDDDDLPVGHLRRSFALPYLVAR
jgi:hypothetical protein